MNSNIGRRLDNTRFSNNFSKPVNSNENHTFSQKNAALPNFPSNYEQTNNTTKDFDSIFEDIKSNFENNNRTENTDSNPFSNLDIGTILKIKSIMDKMNNLGNDPRSNLLLSLKPYLKKDKKEKVDKYIKIFSMTQIFQNLNNGGEK